MAISFFPFATGPGSSVGEAQWSAMARMFLPTAVLDEGYPDPLKVYADSTGMHVKVQPGAAGILGHYMESTAEETLEVNSNGSGNPRFDRVVALLEPGAATMRLEVRQGTPAVNPTPPALRQDATVWEIPLARVTVASGAVTIDAGAVADQRSLALPCGQLPRGLRLHVQATSTPPEFGSTAVDLVTGEVYIPAGRVHVIRAHIRGFSSGDSSGQYKFRIGRNATVLEESVQSVDTPSQTHNGTSILAVEEGLPAGTYTYRVQGARTTTGGTGVVTVADDGGIRLTVEDAGPYPYRTV